MGELDKIIALGANLYLVYIYGRDYLRLRHNLSMKELFLKERKKERKKEKENTKTSTNRMLSILNRSPKFLFKASY